MPCTWCYFRLHDLRVGYIGILRAVIKSVHSWCEEGASEAHVLRTLHSTSGSTLGLTHRGSHVCSRVVRHYLVGERRNNTATNLINVRLVPDRAKYYPAASEERPLRCCRRHQHAPHETLSQGDFQSRFPVSFCGFADEHGRWPSVTDEGRPGGPRTETQGTEPSP